MTFVINFGPLYIFLVPETYDRDIAARFKLQV